MASTFHRGENYFVWFRLRQGFKAAELSQHSRHLNRAPLRSAARGRNAAFSEGARQLRQRGLTGRSQFIDDGRQIRRAGAGAGLYGSGGSLADRARYLGARSPPSVWPRLLAAARAALVRAEIMRRSSSATMAMIPTVNRLACGISAATKSE
jgi:hypothetical protein